MALLTRTLGDTMRRQDNQGMGGGIGAAPNMSSHQFSGALFSGVNGRGIMTPRDSGSGSSQQINLLR